MQDTVFSTFFVVQYELKRDSGLTRPVGMRWIIAVSDQISGIIFSIGHGSVGELTG